MTKSKTRCQWCPRLYASAGAYSNHLATVHPEKDLRSLQNPQSRKRRLSDVDDAQGSTDELDIALLTTILAPDYSYDPSELVSEGSDREAREFSDDEKSDEDNPKADATNPFPLIQAGQPVRPYLFPEQDAGFDFHAPFRHLIDYQLARFFSSAKTSQGNIDKFFKDGILKGLNPTHDVQFRSAYTMYKLVDAAADEPAWHSGIVNYPLLKGVRFRYRNIISAVKYLLRQKAYEAAMVWGPHKEYDKGGNRVYGEIHTATWWEENQVSALRRPASDCQLTMVDRQRFLKGGHLFPFFSHLTKLTSQISPGIKSCGLFI